jgi:hypothetical protein
VSDPSPARRDVIARPYAWMPCQHMLTICKCGAEHFAWAYAMAPSSRPVPGPLEVHGWLQRALANAGWLVVAGSPVCEECGEKHADTAVVRVARAEQARLRRVVVE